MSQQLNELMQKLEQDVSAVRPVAPVRTALVVMFWMALIVMAWVAGHMVLMDMPMASMDIQMKAMGLKVLGLLVMLNMHVICIPHILRSYRYGWFTLALLFITAMLVLALFIQTWMTGMQPIMWEDVKVCAKTLVLAGMLTTVGFFLMRNAAPCTPVKFGMLAGLAASLMAIAAQLMLTMEMYADKVLFSMVLPAAVIVLAAAFIARSYWKW